MASCDNSLQATHQLGEKLESHLEVQIQKVLSTIGTGQASQEQIADLREMKAAIAERLIASEAALADSRVEAVSFANQQQAHLQNISALEAELQLLRDQAREHPLIALRLQGAEKQCVALEQQLAMCQNQLDDSKAEVETKVQEMCRLRDTLESTTADLTQQNTNVAQQLSTCQNLLNDSQAEARTKSQEICRLRDLLESTTANLTEQKNKVAQQLSTCQSQLNGSKVEVEEKAQEMCQLRDLLESTTATLAERNNTVEELIKEKATVQQQTALNENRIRADLSQAYQDETSRQVDKYRNELHSLQQKASTTEKELATEKSNLEQLQREKLAALQTAEQLDGSSNELRRQAKTDRDTILRLQKAVEDNQQHIFQVKNELAAEKSSMKQLQREKLAALQTAEQLDSSSKQLQRQAEADQDTIHYLQQALEANQQQKCQAENELTTEKCSIEQLQGERLAALQAVEQLESSANESRRQAEADRNTIGRLQQAIEEKQQQKCQTEKELGDTQHELHIIRKTQEQENQVNLSKEHGATP